MSTEIGPDRDGEDLLDPERRISDPHVHLGHLGAEPYLLDDLYADLGCGHRVDVVLFVECHTHYDPTRPAALAPLGETRFAVDLARDAARRRGKRGRMTVPAIGGVVAFADLTLGADVVPVLAAQVSAGDGLVRGIRQISAWDAYPTLVGPHSPTMPGLLAAASFRAGFARLSAFDLSFDAWLYHPQLPELTALAREFPETTIVLDHMGGPLGVGPYRVRPDDARVEWRRHLQELARCPNVRIKVGGLGLGLHGLGWQFRDVPITTAEATKAWEPDIVWCIEQFGAERCMFESNFPVDKVAVSYRTLWNVFKRVAASAAEDEKVALFTGTAERVYRLRTATPVHPKLPKR